MTGKGRRAAAGMACPDLSCMQGGESWLARATGPQAGG